MPIICIANSHSDLQFYNSILSKTLINLDFPKSFRIPKENVLFLSEFFFNEQLDH